MADRRSLSDRGCYDLRNGTIHTEARGNTAGPGCIAGVHTEDSFTISGIPAGTPVTFFAELQVTGSLTGNGNVAASVYDAYPGGPSASNGTGTPDPSMHFTVHLPLSHLAGDAFRIRADLNVGGDFPDGVAWLTVCALRRSAAGCDRAFLSELRSSGSDAPGFVGRSRPRIAEAVIVAFPTLEHLGPFLAELLLRHGGVHDRPAPRPLRDRGIQEHELAS